MPGDADSSLGPVSTPVPIICGLLEGSGDESDMATQASPFSRRYRKEQMFLEGRFLELL